MERNDNLEWRTKMIMDSQLDKFEEGTVYLWTDGACSGNPGPGGYAAYMFGWWTDKNGVKWVAWREDMAGAPTTTNNRMELAAVVLGLSLVSKGAKVVLYTDSKYVVNGINDWLAKWIQSNGAKSDGEPVKNWDLWLHIDNFYKRHSIQAVYTKAHASDEWNNRVDEMAQWMAGNPQSGPGGVHRREGREQLTVAAGS